MRSWSWCATCGARAIRSASWSTEATIAIATAAAIAEVAARTPAAATVIVSAAKATAATAATAAVIISAAEATATTTASTTRRRGRCRTVEFQFGGHRLAAVLRELERAALAFTKRLYASFR